MQKINLIFFYYIPAAVARRKAVETETKHLQILLFATGKSLFDTTFVPICNMNQTRLTLRFCAVQIKL